jgi:hypothetical protein
VRRTTSIESRWPDGFGQDVEMTGTARDILTPADGGHPIVLATGAVTLTVSPMRKILAISTEPRHPREQELVGVRAGGASREALASVMGDVRGQPLFQLLDDFAGASLVAGWVWSQWNPEWLREMRARAPMAGQEGFKGPALNVCTGFAEGSSALDAFAGEAVGGQQRTEVLALENPDDPEGWHRMIVPAEPQFRRARRIDVWRDGDTIRIDAGFQDSGNTPDGPRAAIHEYRVHAVLDAATMIVRSLQALPLILPFAECPGATINASRMINQPVGEFRQRVIDQLAGPAGCTHLNDVLRALADVPELAAALPD